MDSNAAPIAGPSSASPPNSPPIALNKRTSSKNAIRDTFNDVQTSGSPPSTPPPTRRRTRLREKERSSDEKRAKGKQPLRSHASAEDYSSHRHSHGLSWHSTTRDSVVDNLLFSLDNLSRQDVENDGVILDSDFDRQKYMFASYPPLPSTNNKPPGVTRPRGHTYSSSMSSVNDRNFINSSPSSYTASTPKGRRSNSGSDFGIKSSITGMMRPPRNSISRKSTDTQKVVRRPTLTDGHARKESAPKESTEIGNTTVVTGGRLHLSRRSMSMDQMYAESIAAGMSMLNRGRPVPSIHSKYEMETTYDDTAPEPTVAGGPRKKENPSAIGPVYVNQAPSKSSLRKITTQTDLRSASKPLRSPPIPFEVRNQANDFVRANSMRGMPLLDKPLPSPALQSQTTRNTSSRERPGFFKRVFGGASSRSNSDVPDRTSSTLIDKEPPTPPPVRTSSSNGTQSRSGTRQASKEHPSGTNYPPPTLNKKPSFFRRRKKSTSESLAPPPLPLGANNVKTGAVEPSPSVSSLRKVMDPYLVDDKARTNGVPIPIPKRDDLSRPTTQESSEDSDHLDIFHSGYTPPPDASLGKRNPMSRSPSEKPKHSVERQPDSPKTKLKVKKRKPDALAPINNQALKERPTTLSPISPRFMGTFGRHASSPVGSARVSPITSEMPIENKENQRPVSRASTGDRIIASAGEIKPEDARKQRVVSSAFSDYAGDGAIKPGSQDRPRSDKSDRFYLKAAWSDDVLHMVASQELAAVTEVSNDGSAPVSAKSPAFQTATSTAFPNSVSSPITPSTRYHSATSLPLPSVTLEGENEKSLGASLPSSMVDEGAEYRERARKIFDGDEEDVTKAEAASWLGEKNMLSTKTLQAFMQLFEFSGQNVLAALRVLCGKLVLKGETQQFDRIIMAFSTRWCECNPNHGFKAQDVIHTICYSLILLNTDLHLADIAERMSRSAYVKNTLPTIRRVVSDAAPNAFDDTVKPAPNSSRHTMPWSNSENSVQTLSPTRTSFEHEKPTMSKRLSIRPPFDRTNSENGTPDSAGIAMGSNALVNQPWTGPMRSWEFEIESILKSFYASIRADPLPLMGAPAVSEMPNTNRNLSVANLTGLKRSNSVVSKAQSDATSFRGLKSMTMGFQSKYNRSRPKIYPSSTISSRTSFDNDSIWSPVQSSTWSKNSFSRTLTSASMQSLGQHLSPSNGDFKHSIGFANALSQAIIREENDFAQAAADNQSASLSVPRGLLEDEALALEGAPWAKEGLVKHKHHLETSGKKAKERTWNEAFAVVSKGKLTLFAFNKSTKTMSMGRKAQTKAQSNGRAASAAAAPRGGGDWMENAEQLDVFVLRQTIASTLPPPGYSKTRPNVWALSLPSGAVHLFQVGTPDIAKEFMTTANYWSARLSKEPLSGGVSNIEYGWSDEVINTALLEPRQGAMSPNPPPSLQNRPMHSHTGSSGGVGRASLQSSIRTSLDTGFGARPRLPGDRVQLAGWHPPSQSMMASQLMEVDQLKALTAYVGNVEAELARHNELKQGIELAYSPRHANYTRALANWQRKSDYLLREIVKFQTYVDSLTGAHKAQEDYCSKKPQLDVSVKPAATASEPVASST